MILPSAYVPIWTGFTAGVACLAGMTFNVRSHRREVVRLQADIRAMALDWHKDTEATTRLREGLSDAERRVRELDLALSVAAAERDTARWDAGGWQACYEEHSRSAESWVKRMDAITAERDALQARWDRAHPPMLRGPNGKLIGRADRVANGAGSAGDGQTGLQAGVEGSPAGESTPQHPHSATDPGNSPVVASVGVIPGVADAAGHATDPAPGAAPLDASAFADAWLADHAQDGHPAQIVDTADPDFGSGRYLGLSRGDDAGQAVQRDGEGGL